MYRAPLLLSLIGTACIAAAVAGGRVGGVAGSGQKGTAFVVQHARMFDGERMHDVADVLVRDGRIVGIGARLPVPPGTEVVDGTGRTLMPGLIDAHTHSFGDALERALVFGVTTVVDMFTDHQQARLWRAGQADGRASNRADIVSAGTLITAPNGHGTQFGRPIPTITSAAEADAFVGARLAEGSDFIKIVYEDGSAYGRQIPSIDAETLRVLIDAARRRQKLVVVHPGSRRGAEQAIAFGAHGLVHVFADEPPGADFGAAVRKAGAFVVPTLSVVQSAAGQAGGVALTQHPSMAPFLTEQERASLAMTFPQRPGSRVRLDHALAAVRQLHAAGVPILAGSDAPNPGTAHGSTVHYELELLVRAGLRPIEALQAATARPAAAFQLEDRGTIAPGKRADLLLVDGDPSSDITATRQIVAVWKGGVRLDRQPPAKTETPSASVSASGLISDFDDGEPNATFGAGWQISTDEMLGGKSSAQMRIVKAGALNSAAALEVSGEIRAGAPFSWAGAMFFPGATPMAPVDLSKFKELVFWARGDGREYQVMLFATRFGSIPVSQGFAAGPEWREHVVPLERFSGADGADVRGILFSADQSTGPFQFVIDGVRLR